MRSHNRTPTELRPISFSCNYILHHKSSVLVEFGDTKVLVCATVDNKVPYHRNNLGGWLTAEYGMLPASTISRKGRTGVKGQPIDGRSIEIQRLIGRALRQAINLQALGTKTITLDCDVIQADGSTRTAAVCGAWVALSLCVKELLSKGEIKGKRFEDIIINQIAAVSVGLVDEAILTDMSYKEDAKAIADANIVATSTGQIVEFQCAAERAPISPSQIMNMTEQALKSISLICDLQRKALES